MRIIKIFLASSSELKDDREQFEIFINRKNKEYIKKDIFLELVIWEDFLDAMSATRLQDEYNKAIANSDVFVSLFKTKVGQYTEEEFLKAFETFRLNQKLLIYTYFKDSQISLSQITHEISSLLNFKKRLNELGHFYKSYKEIEQLKYLFDQQLNKFIPKLITKIEVTSQGEKQELDKSWQSQIRQLEQQLTEERSHSNQLEEIERSYQQQLEEIKINSSQEREELKQNYQRQKQESEQSFQSKISQLEQQLAQKVESFTKQQTNLQAAQEKVAEQEAIIAQLQEQIEQLKSDPKTTAKDKVKLKSEKGVDYTKLRDLLAAREWKKADWETAQVMFKVANRESEGWLRKSDIDNFPCEDLRIINQLWLHYSNGKFGFSVQKEIYESLRGTRQYNEKVWRTFGDRIGWNKGMKWLNYDELTFNLDEAPTAHLPIAVGAIRAGNFLLMAREGIKIELIGSSNSRKPIIFSRTKACNL